MRKMGMLQYMLMGLAGMLVGCAHAEYAKEGAGDPYGKPGFYTKMDDGRLWVFAEGSQEHKEHLEKGKPAKFAVRPGAGPGGITLLSVEMDTIVAYIVARNGFYTALDKDGRLWVFEDGSESLASYKEQGKPAKHVVRPGAGPLGLTVKSVDADVIDAYLAAN